MVAKLEEERFYISQGHVPVFIDVFEPHVPTLNKAHSLLRPMLLFVVGQAGHGD